MKNTIDFLDEVRSIAQIGLHYAKDPYDIERYTRLIDLCSAQYGAFTGLETSAIKERFNQELGYITPKVGVNGIVFSNDGKALLEKRSDDGLWGIPGGWAEIGESPELSVSRELLEETGLIVEVKELIQVFSRLPSDYTQPHTSYHLLYRCEVISGSFTRSHESLEIGYYDINSISGWHRDHGDMARAALLHLRKFETTLG